MRWIDILAASLSNLRRRKLRSALTMLGVVIGTAAIVVTISLGYGAEKTQMAQLESATNLRLINVYPYMGYSASEDGSSSGRRISKITDSVVAQVRRLKGVEAVTPVVQVYSPTFILKTGRYENYTTLIAVSPADFSKIVGLKSGRYFSSSTSQMEFLMTEWPMMEFRDPKKDTEYIDTWTLMYEGKELPLPKINWLKAQYDLTMQWEDWESVDDEGNPKILTQDYKARMIGIMDLDIQSNDFWTYGTGSVVNINFLKRLQRENKALFKEMGLTSMLESYNDLYVLADSVDAVEGLVKELTDMGLSCYSPIQTLTYMREQIQTMQSFLGFIGAISMAVAALSIANTMMMSIYERTREIGVMKVLGCRMSNIRMMFLSEAAYIGLFGGALGLILSYALSYALNNVQWLQSMVASIMASGSLFGSGDGSTTSIIPLSLSLGTWLFVVVIAVASGFYPAQRAMKLSSLAAIRSAE